MTLINYRLWKLVPQSYNPWNIKVLEYVYVRWATVFK
jgi:hypothetical protein